jgi:hypothetical protein
LQHSDEAVQGARVTDLSDRIGGEDEHMALLTWVLQESDEGLQSGAADPAKSFGRLFAHGRLRIA